MTENFSQWLRDHESYIDPALKKEIRERLHCLEYTPRFLRSYIESIIQRVIKIPVFIQWKSLHLLFTDAIQLPMRRKKLKITQTFPEIGISFARLSIAQIRELIEWDHVEKLSLDRKVCHCLHVAAPVIQAPEVWKSENEGEGATIAILDTGIYPHSDLESRIIAFQDFINGDHQPYDDNGHGTHCAGCAAGSGISSQGKYKGIAPASKLVGLKVLNQEGESQMSDIMRGIHWCIQNKERYNIRIISMSLGALSEMSYKEDPICMMADLAWRAGIVVVAAAGNAGPSPQTVTSPGTHPQIITVGASNDQRTVPNSDDQVATFSSRGPTIDGFDKPDILAPGTNIISLRSNFSYLDGLMSGNRVNEDYFLLSGTSMATPIVSGVVALILTQYPHLQPDEVKKLLLESAVSLNQNINSQGHGQVDAYQAILKKTSS